MSNPDLIPRKDNLFDLFQEICFRSVQTNAEKWKIPAETISAVTAYQKKWTGAFALVENPATRTTITVQSKQLARKDYEAQLRILIKAYIAYNPLISDKERVEMGLPVYKKTRTTVSVPDSIPEITAIDRNTVRCVIVHFCNSENRHRAKPTGVQGVLVRYTISDTRPTGIDDFKHSVLHTKSPFILRFAESERNKTVYFVLAWQTTRGEIGNFGEIQSLNVP
ncbi:MAG: hypothetical protein LBM07_04640 [Culturomica sp.]|jgi:hypothetical protein|nr:hypothetical protein [Culturomica sp.]